MGQLAVEEVEILNELLVLIRDSITSYRVAASQSDNRALQRCLLRRADHRQYIADRLVEAVEALGGDPAEHDGSGPGFPFLNFGELLRAEDALAVHQMAREERELRNRYQQALHDESLTEVARDAIQAACDSLWPVNDVMHGFLPALRSRLHFV